MQFHQLRYFVSAVEQGSMSQAAKHCFVSQPSLSQQVKKLEQTIGSDLFIRGKGALTLTEEGKILYEEAKTILASIHLAEKKIKDFSHNKSSDLSFGILPTISPYIINDIMAGLNQNSSILKINIQETYSHELVTACLQRELDYIITSGPIKNDELAVHSLSNDPFCVALRDDHPLANHAKINLQDLHNEFFILIKSMHCLYAQISAICKNADFSPNIKFETAHIETIQRLIVEGHGISILPDISKRISKPRLKYIPLSEEPHREIVYAHRKDFVRSGAHERFLSIVGSIY